KTIPEPAFFICRMLEYSLIC
ncbi:hypothetical protein CP8484711_1110B, partial [Chlamydia psittaci 84-8471/1]